MLSFRDEWTIWSNDIFVLYFCNSQGFPISEDYYLSSYSECNWDKTKPNGVCPDSFLSGGADGLNNSQMLHGQQIDGKLFWQPSIPSLVL